MDERRKRKTTSVESIFSKGSVQHHTTPGKVQPTELQNSRDPARLTFPIMRAFSGQEVLLALTPKITSHVAEAEGWQRGHNDHELGQPSFSLPLDRHCEGRDTCK